MHSTRLCRYVSSNVGNRYRERVNLPPSSIVVCPRRSSIPLPTEYQISGVILVWSSQAPCESELASAIISTVCAKNQAVSVIERCDRKRLDMLTPAVPGRTRTWARATFGFKMTRLVSEGLLLQVANPMKAPYSGRVTLRAPMCCAPATWLRPSFSVSLINFSSYAKYGKRMQQVTEWAFLLHDLTRAMALLGE